MSAFLLWARKPQGWICQILRGAGAIGLVVLLLPWVPAVCGSAGLGAAQGCSRSLLHHCRCAAAKQGLLVISPPAQSFGSKGGSMFPQGQVWALLLI